MHSTGQIATQRDPPSIPSHSLHVFGSITYMSPSLIASLGHSGRQSPQAVHSSVILIAMKFTSLPWFFVSSSAPIKNFDKYTKIKVKLSTIIYGIPEKLIVDSKAMPKGILKINFTR
jgi:hypothetical protein